MNTSHLLPFTQPEIDLYSGYAIDNAILPASIRIPYVINNFSSIGMQEDEFHYLNPIFPNCSSPKIKFTSLPLSDFCNYQDNEILSFLMNQLSQDKYIKIPLNHYCISRTQRYLQMNFLHDHALIYGYDLEASTFKVADNFQKGKFISIDVSFEEVVQAITSAVHVLAEQKIPRLAKIFLLDVVDSAGISEPVNLSELTERLQEHNQGTFSGQKEFLFDDAFNTPPPEINGIQIYDYFYEYVEALPSKDYVDVRGFHAMYNHKKVLNIAYLYLVDHRIIELNPAMITNLNQLEENSQVIRNLVLRYEVIRTAKIVESLKKHITEIKSLEYTVINELCRCLTLYKSGLVGK